MRQIFQTVVSIAILLQVATCVANDPTTEVLLEDTSIVSEP